MAQRELEDFRKTWRNELESKNHEQTASHVSKARTDEPTLIGGKKSLHKIVENNDDISTFPSVGIANGLLNGWIQNPLEYDDTVLSYVKSTKHQLYDDKQLSYGGNSKKRKLIDQLIADLDEINEIPFFDLTVPREVAINIFKHLDMLDLCRCSMVSHSWRIIAEDEWLWWRISVKLDHLTQQQTTDNENWKLIVKDAVTYNDTLTRNWKNRVGKASTLEYYKGKILCVADSQDRKVVAGYTSGEVKFWNLNTGYDQTFQASNTSLIVDETHEEGTLDNTITSIAIGNSYIVAGYTQGFVDVWRLDGEISPCMSYRCNFGIKGVSIVDSVVASCCDRSVRLDVIDDGLITSTKEANVGELVKLVKILPSESFVNQSHSMRGSQSYSAVIASNSKVQILTNGVVGLSAIHELAASMLTCMDATPTHMACGVTTYGLLSGSKTYVYCISTGRLLTSFRGHCGCISVVDMARAPPYTLVTGGVDKMCCVHDLRSGETVLRLQGQGRTISTVQMDKWKVISGAEDGLVTVYDQRMASKLWEFHNRHPVRHLNFDTDVLIAAHIPSERFHPIVEDNDQIMHKRHRGVIQLYDFSVSMTSRGIPSICMSSYDEPIGYNYNIGLTVPYDTV